MGTRPHQIILDTDIGSDVDDSLALAVLLGAHDIHLVGITTVYGDTALRARVAKRLIRLSGHPTAVPVHAGAQETLTGRPVWWAGHEGRIYNDLDSEMIDGHDGPAFLAEQVTANPGTIDIVAIGPLTNIARAISSSAKFAPAVKHLTIMGGQFDQPDPEHNIRSDPEAADIVLRSGIPTTVTGIEITRRVHLTDHAVEQIGRAGPLGHTLAVEIGQWISYTQQNFNEPWNIPHDPITVLTLLQPNLFSFRRGKIRLRAGTPEGATLFDPAPRGIAQIVTGINADATARRIVDHIKAADHSHTAHAEA
jgi:purine nucleosidase